MVNIRAWPDWDAKFPLTPSSVKSITEGRLALSPRSELKYLILKPSPQPSPCEGGSFTEAARLGTCVACIILLVGSGLFNDAAGDPGLQAIIIEVAGRNLR